MEIESPLLSPIPKFRAKGTPSTSSTDMIDPEAQVRQFVLTSSDFNALSKKMSDFNLEEKENGRHPTDRFIPLRKARKANIGLKETNTSRVPQKGESIEELSKVSVDEVFRAVMLSEGNDKLFNFLGENIRRDPLSRKSMLLDCDSEKMSRLQKGGLLDGGPRPIEKTPYKILDAPNLVNDFYLNLIEWSPSDILSVALSSSIFLWNAKTQNVSQFLNISPAIVTGMSWNSRGTQLAVGNSLGVVEIWDVTKKKKVQELAGHQKRVTSIDWSPHDLIATGSRDKTIRISDRRVGNTPVVPLNKGHTHEVCGLKWSLDGSTLASGGNDNKLMLWSCHSSDPIYKFNQHTAAVKGLAWSPHNHGILLSGGGTADKTIKVWNMLNGSLLDSIDTGSQVINLAFSPQTREFVSTHGYSDNEIIVWNYPSLQKMCTLTGHTSRVLYLAMSPSGENIVTGAGDQTLRFWNVFPGNKKQAKGQNRLSTLELR